MMQKFRELLLMTEQFSDWADHPELFKLYEYPDEKCFELQINKLPDRPITVTPRELHLDVPQQFNSMQSEFRLLDGFVTCGSPDGGCIMFTWENTY